MSCASAYQSNSTSSDTFTTKCRMTTPMNHLFSPDGILLGVTFSKTLCELTKFYNASSFINCQEDVNPKLS